MAARRESDEQGSDTRGRTGALAAHAYELMDRGSELERAELTTMICERVLDLVGADTAVLWAAEDDRHPHAEKLVGKRPSQAGVAVEKELVSLITSDGGRLINSDEAPLRPRLVQLCGRLRDERSGAVCVGLQRRNELLGILCVHRVGCGGFDGSEAADAERFARFAALALHQLAERERAELDEVTGLPGRKYLLRELDEWVASGEIFALACVDFDGLKAVNEQVGYEAGNALIRAVAGAIAELLGHDEMIGRLHGRGGDEFVCLLAERDQRSLDARCSELEAQLDRAEVPDEVASYYLGVSIGAALANPKLAAGDLFTAAENAMRRRKQERRRSQGRTDDDRGRRGR